MDDEPRVLESLAVLLRKEYDAQIATRPDQALQKLNEMTDLAVVVSDMRMPAMDGASFLHEVMLRRPEVTRIMLTGETGRDLAIAAVNKGQVFRFLTKPCGIEDLKIALDAAVIQHRVIMAERAVLQETLIGCIRSLMEVLAIASPAAFGRAERIKREAMDVAARLGCGDFWQLEAAALLSQIGYVALPSSLIDEMQDGKPLSPDEVAKVGAVPDISMKLLDHIPRLEPVIQILVALTWPDPAVTALGTGTIGHGTKILGAVMEYDSQLTQGKTREEIFAHLRGRSDRYGRDVIDALEAGIRARFPSEMGVDMLLRQVRPGMTLLQEMRNSSGALIVPKGFEVTKTFLERIGNIAPELLDKLVRIAERTAEPPRNQA